MSYQPREMSQLEKDLRLLLAGSISGVVSRTATAPFERIKILKSINHPIYTPLSVAGSLNHMLRNEGFLSLFKGNFVNCVRIAPFTGLEFYTYDFCRRKLGSTDKLTIVDSLIYGGISGAVASTFTYPLDIVRTLLAVQVEKKDAQFKGIIKTLRDIHRKDGVLGLYRGWVPTIVGIVPFISVKLTSYNIIKKHTYGLNHEIPFVPNMAIGAAAGVISATVTFPLELIKRRLQVKAMDGSVQYKGMTDCIVRIYREEGFRGYFKGLIACYWKVIPAIAIAFTVNSYAKAALGVSQIKHH
eukprot:TRINITY_DN3791_c0_g1_i3.p1 TRINITY_DN3791_c0_g1~~TRINITY_DN3791_c0_g1_i3.p1  ORF type:complete len:299 (-),score=61.68 TRINITY_DN3791_c0_g1_i3:99-995(-)